MSTIPQTRPTTQRLTAVIIATDNNRASITYITEARATALYVAGDLTLVERHGEFVYALRGASAGGVR